ncbi:hypothetical protein STEG23_026107 [Scotinomys teguina]
MSAATIVHDTSEAVALCPALGLYLKPIARMTISVALPPRKPPGRSISTWEVMERLKAMAAAAHPAPFSALRIAKSTLDFIRLEGEVEHRGLVRAFLGLLDGKTIKLPGFADALRVRAAEFRPDAPSRRDWDAFFRDAPDMDEARPGERPDTVHLEGLPCRWFAPRAGASEGGDANSGGDGGCNGGNGGNNGGNGENSTNNGGTGGNNSDNGENSGKNGGNNASCGGYGGNSGRNSGNPTNHGSTGPSPSSLGSGERPSEAVLRQAFGAFGEIRQVDIPMLDPYREEMTGRSFQTFSFGGHLQFEAYVQYREYAGFLRAMAALRGAKLMFKGEDGKAVACNIKVTFDSTKHLSDASIRRRQLERQKLQELERRREEQKRREREAEERRRAEERKQKEQEEQERARRKEEKLRRREQRQRARASRRHRRRAERLAAEEQQRLQARVRLEERRLLLAQRNLQSVRLVAALLRRAKAACLAQRQEERRRLQEAELRRVEREKARALGLQRRERELRQRLLALLLGRGDPVADHAPPRPGRPQDTLHGNPGLEAQADDAAAAADALLRPVLDILHGVARAGRPLRGGGEDPVPQKPGSAMKSQSVARDPGCEDGDPDVCNRDPEPPRDPGQHRPQKRGRGDGERERKRGRRHHGDRSRSGSNPRAWDG